MTPGRSKGAVRHASQSGSQRTPASVTAMTSPVAARMAALRPWAMLAPGASMILSGSRPAWAWSAATVPSREPPSATTTSSGGRVWAASEANRPWMASPSFKTVKITLTRMRVII